MKPRRRIDLPANPPELDEPGWDEGALYLEIEEPQPASRSFGRRGCSSWTTGASNRLAEKGESK